MHDCRSLLAIFLLLIPFGSMAHDSPEHTVQDFYAWAIHTTSNDLDKEAARVRPLLGQELFTALVAQRAYEEACARLVPADVKPHMLDQSPFFLWPDEVQALQSTKATITGDTARVFAQLAYDDAHWTDTVILRREEGRWVILDIQWQEHSLTERLVEFASHRCEP